MRKDYGSGNNVCCVIFPSFRCWLNPQANITITFYRPRIKEVRRSNFMCFFFMCSSAGHRFKCDLHLYEEHCAAVGQVRVREKRIPGGI